MKIRILPALLLASLAQLPANGESAPTHKPRIEVCFVLDTTGSMGGLIEGAKQKIWSIANEMVSAKPTPDLKIGLIGYRDRGDEYVVKSFKLTDDIDSIYGELQKFQATGGGDEPESVNEALAEAVNKMPWSEDRDVLKIIFLVGDAPPHMDYKNGPKYPDVCSDAAKKDVIINTVQCGSIASTTPVWKEIAKLSEGSFAAIAQNGNVAVIDTPVDAKLAELNRKIGATLIPYGDGKLQREVRTKQALAEAVSAPAAADRLSYNAKTGKSVQGSGELIDALAAGKVKLDDIKTKDLPPELQKLDKDALKALVGKKRDERAQLQKQIEELAKERAAFIAAEAKRRKSESKGDSFDKNVSETIRTEAARKGIHYGE